MQRCLFSLKVFLGENALGVVVPQLQKQSTNRSIVHCAVQMLACGGRKLSSNHRDRTDMMCIFVLFCFSAVLRAVSLSSPREPLILLIGNLLIVKVTVANSSQHRAAANDVDTALWRCFHILLFRQK